MVAILSGGDELMMELLTRMISELHFIFEFTYSL